MGLYFTDYRDLADNNLFVTFTGVSGLKLQLL